MTIWQQLLMTSLGAFFGFLSALVLFWVKESVSEKKKEHALIQNLIYELNYNIALYEKYITEITECIEAVNAGNRNTYISVNYSFIARYFAIQFYQAGMIQKYLHHEDMKRWNDFLINLPEGGQAFVLGRLEAWRNNAISRDEVFVPLNLERKQINYALEITRYIKTKIQSR